MEISWKALLYDWNGANQALFLVINQGLPDILVPVAWLGSTLGSYWSAPLAFIAIGWWTQRANQPGVSKSITLQMSRFAVACLLALILASMLKWGLDFPRPSAVLGATAHIVGAGESRYGFPSGHSVYAALIVGTLWPLAPGSMRALLAGFLLWVGWSRIAVGAHFPVDVLAGWALGFVCVRISLYLVQIAPETVYVRRVTGASNERHNGAVNIPGFVPMPTPGYIIPILKYQTMAMQPENRPYNSSPSWLKSGFGWWILALFIASADQAIKYAVHTGLTYGESIPIASFFNLVHRWNTGAAFSFLADAGGWQRYFFSTVALTVSTVLAWMLTKPQLKIEALSYSLILGGALGNVIDRIHRGYVVDFLDFHWQGWHWPAFNLADIGICVGAALLVAGAFLTSRNPQLLQR